MQLNALVDENDQTSDVGRVLRTFFPDSEMRHFVADSAVLRRVYGDTADWEVWGTGPNYERFDYSGESEPVGVDGLSVITTGRSPTDAEIRALPRIVLAHQVQLVQRNGRWVLPMETATVAALLALSDTLTERCPYGHDPRPCGSIAAQLATKIQASPPVVRTRFRGMLDGAMTTRREAGVMDSIQVTLLDVEEMMAGSSWLIAELVNASAVPLGSVHYVLEASDGSVVGDTISALMVFAPHSRRRHEVGIPRPNRTPVRARVTSLRIED
jgi:hypothetical protein